MDDHQCNLMNFIEFQHQKSYWYTLDITVNDDHYE